MQIEGVKPARSFGVMIVVSSPYRVLPLAPLTNPAATKLRLYFNKQEQILKTPPPSAV
jgi:hypothetical protein